MRTKLFLLVVVLSLLIPLSTQVIAQDDAITLTFTQWIPADSERGEVFVQIAEEYTAMNPNVTVEFDFIPFADYVTTLPLRLSGSNPPDGGWLLENVAPTWVESGILADMGDQLRSDEAYNFDDLSSAAMELWVEGESVYGIPFSTSPFLLIYNRDVFAAAGVDTPDVMIENDTYTWENLAAALATIAQETDAVGLQSVNGALYTGERVWHTVTPVIRAYGGDAWDADNNCTLNSAESVAGLQFFHDMIFADGSVEQPGQAIDFYSGGVGILMGQLSRVAPLADAEFGWDIAPMPSGPAGQADVIGQAAIVAFRNSPNPEVAIDFLSFLTNEENTLRIAEFFPPIRASVLETDVLLEANPNIAPESMQQAVIAPTLNGRVLPTHPNFPTIDLTARPFFDMLWNADADVQVIADQLCEAIQPLLND